MINNYYCVYYFNPVLLMYKTFFVNKLDKSDKN